MQAGDIVRIPDVFYSFNDNGFTQLVLPTGFLVQPYDMTNAALVVPAKTLLDKFQLL